MRSFQHKLLPVTLRIPYGLSYHPKARDVFMSQHGCTETRSEHDRHALSRLVYACSKSLSTAGPMSVCFYYCAQVRPGAKLLSANIFILHSFISVSRDVLCHTIQTVNWALLSTDKDSLGSKTGTASPEGFYENKCVRFCSLPKQGLLKL